MNSTDEPERIHPWILDRWVDVALLLLLLLSLGLLVLSILPFLFEAGVVVIVADSVPDAKCNIIIININDALDKLGKMDQHPSSIFARQGTTIKVPRWLGWSALNEMASMVYMG